VRATLERAAAAAAVAYVVLYVAAFALGIEVGKSDREITEYYADAGHRQREVVAFFLIAGAALSLVVFGTLVRRLLDEAGSSVLATLAFAGAVASGALVLAGDALSRAAAFSAMDEDFQLEPNTRRLFENAGFLLFVSAALAAILLVAAVAAEGLRRGVFPRWLGWVSAVVAVLLPLAIGFVGFLVLWVWLLVMAVVLVRVRDRGAAELPA